MWAVVIWQNGKLSSQFSEVIFSQFHILWWLEASSNIAAKPGVEDFHPHFATKIGTLWTKYNKDKQKRSWAW